MPRRGGDPYATALTHYVEAGDTRRSAKKHRTGSTLRRSAHRVRGEGSFWFSDTQRIAARVRQRQSPTSYNSPVDDLPENHNRGAFVNGLEYSLGKHRRWELIAELAEAEQHQLVVDCDPNRGTNRASQERKLKRLRPFAGRANPIKNEAKQLTADGKTPRRNVFIAKGRNGTIVYERRTPGKKVRRCDQPATPSTRWIQPQHLFLWLPSFQAKADMNRISLRKLKSVNLHSFKGKSRLMRAERVRQLADLQSQGFDYRARAQIAVRNKMTREKFTRFHL